MKIILSSIILLALTGCATHNGWPWYLRTDSNRQIMPPSSPVKAMSPKERALQSTPRAAVAPPVARKPMEVEIWVDGAISESRHEVQTSTNLRDPNSWVKVQEAVDRFFWIPNPLEPQRFFRVYTP